MMFMQHKTQRLVVSCLMLLAFSASPALAASIGVGDIAIIGINTDAPDEFAWVPLINLDAGDQLFFTDTGWNTGGGSFANTTESAYLFTIPAGGITAGDVQLVNIAGAPPSYAPIGGAEFNGLAPLLSSFGDSVAIFTGTPAAPQFVFAATNHASEWGLGASSNSTTDLYSGLFDGVNAVAHGSSPDPDTGEFDNIYYTGITTGDAATLLSAIADDQNWSGSQSYIADITNGTLVNGFNVIPEPTTLLLGGIAGLGMITRRSRSAC